MTAKFKLYHHAFSGAKLCWDVVETTEGADGRLHKKVVKSFDWRDEAMDYVDMLRKNRDAIVSVTETADG